MRQLVWKLLQVVLLDGRTWHGTGVNKTSSDRAAILSSWCGPQFRPQENYLLGIDPCVYKKANNDLLKLLGFKIWNGYGRTENPTDEFVGLKNKVVGSLKNTEVN